MTNSSTGAAATPAHEDGTGRRRQILTAAMGLFQQRGYHATGMNDIGAEVGLTGPALYRHFENKADILETLLLRAADYMERRVGAAVAGNHHPRVILEALVGDLIDVLMRYPAIVAIAETERRHLPPRARAIYDRSSRLRVTEWVGPLLQLRPDLGESEARRVVEATHALLQRAVRPAPGVSPERARALLYSAAVNILLNPLPRPSDDRPP